MPDGSALEDVLRAIEMRIEPGWGPGSARIVRRFALEARVGDFVWTRDTVGRYLLCRLTGEYRYDGSEAADAVDVYQVRSAEWARPLNDLDVPGGVVRAFVGTSDSFSRIHDLGARRLTTFLWEKLHNRPLPALDLTMREILTIHLDPYDVEDLVYVWLQATANYLALPRSRKRDTPAYEYTLIHRETGRRAIAQIKTGLTPVDLAALAAAVTDSRTNTFAYATSGRYIGDTSQVTRVIGDAELLAFARQHPQFLPPRVRTWFELACD
jgi:hypothetical protein